MSVWYWEEFDELLLMVSNQVIGNFDINEIDEVYWPRVSLSNCVYIGEFE
jgi:hypothetical protein